MTSAITLSATTRTARRISGRPTMRVGRACTPTWALQAQRRTRMTHGAQFTFNYTLGRLGPGIRPIPRTQRHGEPDLFHPGHHAGRVRTMADHPRTLYLDVGYVRHQERTDSRQIPVHAPGDREQRVQPSHDRARKHEHSEHEFRTGRPPAATAAWFSAPTSCSKEVWGRQSCRHDCRPHAGSFRQDTSARRRISPGIDVCTIGTYT